MEIVVSTISIFNLLQMLLLFVTAVELVNAAGCINELHLTGIERVG